MGRSTAWNLPDPEICEQARISRDPRFDGLFFTAVSSTRIYCRSVCPVPTVKRDHVRYYPSAAAAEDAGYRPCLRCRPELAPAAWRQGDAALQRALGLIDEGYLIDRPLAALARQVDLSERQLRRLFDERLGASPLSVYATRRLLFAKQLLTETSLPITRIALEAGFGSLRRFNTCFREAYRRPPSDLRRRPGHSGQETLVLRLDYRPPYDFQAVLDTLRRRAVPHVEVVGRATYARTFGPPESPGWLQVGVWSPRHDALRLTLHCPRAVRLLDVVTRVRRMMDLDADPCTIQLALSRDVLLRRRIHQQRGLRLPGPWDGLEESIRALFQRDHPHDAPASALIRELGHVLDPPFPRGLGHLFPTATALAECGTRRLQRFGLSPDTAGAAVAVARAAIQGEISFSAAQTLENFVDRWVALTGTDPGSAHTVAARALGHPDAFPVDLLRAFSSSADRTGRVPLQQLEARSELWRPWRAYGLAYLLGAAWPTSVDPARPTTLTENGR